MARKTALGGGRASGVATEAVRSRRTGETGAHGSEIHTGTAPESAGRTAATGDGVFFIMGQGRDVDWPAGVQQHL